MPTPANKATRVYRGCGATHRRVSGVAGNMPSTLQGLTVLRPIPRIPKGGRSKSPCAVLLMSCRRYTLGHRYLERFESFWGGGASLM